VLISGGKLLNAEFVQHEKTQNKKKAAELQLGIKAKES